MVVVPDELKTSKCLIQVQPYHPLGGRIGQHFISTESYRAGLSAGEYSGLVFHHIKEQAAWPLVIYFWGTNDNKTISKGYFTFKQVCNFKLLFNDRLIIDWVTWQHPSLVLGYCFSNGWGGHTHTHNLEIINMVYFFFKRGEMRLFKMFHCHHFEHCWVLTDVYI